MAGAEPSERRARARRLIPARLATVAVGGLLLFLAIGRLGRGVATLLLPNEATFGEAILYDHAARILRGEPLYLPLDRPPYSVAAYTPVYYALAASLRAIAGPGFPPGRALSFAAAAVAALLIGLLTARRAGSRWAGAFAACLFVALAFPGRNPWFSLYKADVLGVALSIGAVSMLGGRRTTARVVAGGALAALAILTKQTFVAAALAGTAWLFRENRRQATTFAGVCLGLLVAAGAALEGWTGAFFSNAFFANAVPPRRDALLPNLAALAQFQAMPILLAGLYAFDRARSGSKPSRDLLVLYWAAGFLALAGLARPGSNHNYWIELAGASSILATLALWDRLGAVSEARPIRAGLPAVLLGANAAFALLLLGGPKGPVRSVLYWRPDTPPEFSDLVARVRSEPREVLADPPDVVVLADRENLLELYFSAIRESQGKWDPGPLVRRICGGEIGLVVLRYTLDSDARGIYQGYPYWPPSVLAALRERMEPAGEEAGRFLYAPRPGAAVSSEPGRATICGGGPAPR
jgi:hypothetical protein